MEIEMDSEMAKQKPKDLEMEIEMVTEKNLRLMTHLGFQKVNPMMSQH